MAVVDGNTPVERLLVGIHLERSEASTSTTANVLESPVTSQCETTASLAKLTPASSVHNNSPSEPKGSRSHDPRSPVSPQTSCVSEEVAGPQRLEQLRVVSDLIAKYELATTAALTPDP